MKKFISLSEKFNFKFRVVKFQINFGSSVPGSFSQNFRLQPDPDSQHWFKYWTQLTIKRRKKQRVKERDEWKAPGEHEVVQMPVPDPQQVGYDTVAGTALHVRVHALRRHAVRTRLLQYEQNWQKSNVRIINLSELLTIKHCRNN